uniref:TPD52 like 1 n=1 Tax=Zosterops lateralis melanops TaxID=1220523 RepID=A0A8D2NNZ7_ZOSLA
MISEEEKEELKIELAKLEDEISTLRQVLAAKEKHLVEIKQKLGISLMNELKQNFSKSWHDMQTTSAYKKTHETLSHAGQKATAAISNVGTAISKKFGDMRPRLVGQATREAVLKKFSALQLMPVLRAPWLALVSLKVKKSFSVKQQILLSPTCLSSETCPVIFSLRSPHNLCNKVLSALENCHPGLVLEKFSLFLFQISHFTRYFVHHQNHMQVIGYNALNSVLNDCVKK